jgi:tetratricopeptide (TPR) repeat protein
VTSPSAYPEPTPTDPNATRAEARRFTFDGRTSEAIALLQTARRRSDGSYSPAEQARLTLEEGSIRSLEIFQGTGSFEETYAVLAEGEALADAAGDPQLIATAQDALGMARYYQALATRGDFAPALEALAAALTIRETGEDSRALAESVFHVGLVYQNTGAWEPARQHFERAIAIAEADGDALEHSYAIRHLGMYYQSQASDLITARACYERSLELREQIGFRIFLPFSHLALGELLVELGELDEAERHFTAAYEIASDIASPSQTTFALLLLGELHEQRGASDRARDCYQRGLRAADEAGFERGRARAVANLARIDTA